MLLEKSTNEGEINVQKRLIIGLALIVGIGVAIFSYTTINQRVELATKTVQVVVLKTDVDAYSAISAKNIETKAVPPYLVDDYTAIKPEQVSDRVTSAPIYAGKPIDMRNIVDPKEDMQDKQVVGIYVDAARFAGVTEGDIVDVYRVSVAAGNPSPCIASNSRVLKITDEKGVALKNLEGQKQGQPHIVYLLVKPSEVPQVVQGSVVQEKTYLALSKKSKESTPIPVAEVVED